jgi:hypothetical protein
MLYLRGQTVLVLKVLLFFIGVFLSFASKCIPRVRAQLGVDKIITLGSKGGGVRSFIINNRIVSSQVGVVPNADSTLIFDTAWQGASTLLARDAVARLCAGLGEKTINFKGDLPNILWLYELVMHYIPLRGNSWRVRMPDAYISPSDSGLVGSRIVREPVVEMLDPLWSNAVNQRDRIVLWSVGRGEDVSGKNPIFRHVIDTEESDDNTING